MWLHSVTSTLSNFQMNHQICYIFAANHTHNISHMRIFPLSLSKSELKLYKQSWSEFCFSYHVAIMKRLRSPTCGKRGGLKPNASFCSEQFQIRVPVFVSSCSFQGVRRVMDRPVGFKYTYTLFVLLYVQHLLYI